MQCLILAGGLGTRMARFTASRPKALIPVLGRPFAEWQLDWLAAEGVTEVVYSVGYRADMVQSALGDGGRWGLPITYIDEGLALRGTAGAIRLAADRGVLADSFFVLYGDSFLSVDLCSVWAAYLASGRPALMTVFRNNGQWDRSNTVYAGGVISLYDKASPQGEGMSYIDYGLGVFSLGVIDRMVPAGVPADLAGVYHQLSLDGELAGYEAAERFYEIGSEEGLLALEAALSPRP